MTFKPGKTYYTRSICDHNCIFEVTVSKRTAKTITTSEDKRLKVYTNEDGIEYVKPHGSYSMCAIIRADADVRPLTDWELAQ